MHKWQIIKYENGGIGGKFNGNCYVNPDGRLSDNLLAIPIKIRYRHYRSGESEQYLWGGMYYGLKVIDDIDCYNLQLNIAGDVYYIQDFSMHYNETYNVETFIVNDEFTCIIRDKWNNLRFKHVTSVTNSSFGSILFYIGAGRMSDASAALCFKGVIFAFQYYDAVENEYAKLIFRKNYLNVQDYEVADHFRIKNAILYNESPALFWSGKTDISDYVVSLSKLKYRTDDYHIPLIQRASITLKNGTDLKIDDIVSIKDSLTDSIQYIYRVKSIKSEEYNQSVIEMEDILGDLSDVYMRNILRNTNSFSVLRYDWWNTLDPIYFTGNYQITEYFHDPFNPDYCWISFLFLIKMLYGVLEIDYMLNIDVSELESSISYLKQNQSNISFKAIALNLYILRSIGNNKDGDCQTNILQIVRSLFNALRISYRIFDSSIKLEEIDNSDILYPVTNRLTYRETITDSVNGYAISCNRLSTSQDYWNNDIDWSNTVSNEYFVSPSDEMLRNSLEKLTLPDHFNIGIHGSVNNHFSVVNPAIEQQLAVKLNELYTGKKLETEYSHCFTPTHLCSYSIKEDDIVNNISEVKLQSYQGGL